MRFPRWALIIALAATAAGLVATAAALAASPPIVIQNATVLTVTKGTFQGSVVIEDGRIAALGPKVTIPPGAQVIDATNLYLMPGIIDCHTHIASEATNEGSIPVSSMVRVEDVLNPEDISIYRALAGGVTTANVLHGSANAIGGQCSVIKMRWGKTTGRELLFEGARPGIKFALGENPKRLGGQQAFPGAPATPPRYPATRMGVEDVIREAFEQARLYQRSWRDYEARKAAGEAVLAPARNLKLDPLVEVLEGQRLVHAHCYRADEILMLLRVADEFGFKIRTLQHALEAYKVAREIAAHGAGVSTFSDWWSYKIEAFDAIPYNAALLEARGVLVSFNSDDVQAELMRRLNLEAAKAVKYGGVSEDQALAMITINPARQLMIDSLVGSIETGKTADLVLYDGHPLSNFSKVTKVFIDGQMYFDRERDLAERPQREGRRKELEARAAEQQKKNAPPMKKDSQRRPQ